jgi:uncharacterized membrane protein YdbT with pleckstrin-like domain
MSQQQGSRVAAETSSSRAESSRAESPRSEEILFQDRPAAIPGVGGLCLAILTLGLYFLYAKLRSMSLHYKITSQRVVIERGLLSKRMEQIDLYRVVDFVVERPFGQRIMGTGNLVLEAMDKTTPEVRLDHLKTDVVALYERLREATQVEKQRRGVRVVDAEPAGVVS